MSLYSISEEFSRLRPIAFLEDFAAVYSVRGHEMACEEIMKLFVSAFKHAENLVM